VAFFFILKRSVDHLGGVIVLLAAEAHLFPAIVEMYAEEPLLYLELIEAYHDSLIACLRACVDDCCVELVGCRYLSSSDNWWNLPNPGMIACAQRLYHIDLNLSLFVCAEDSAWFSIARDLGCANIRSELLFQSKSKCGWCVSDRVRKFGVIPAVNNHSDWLFTRMMSGGKEEQEHFDKRGECAGCFWMNLVQPNNLEIEANQPEQRFDLYFIIFYYFLKNKQTTKRKRLLAFDEEFNMEEYLEERPIQIQKLDSEDVII
jgi:hypothetical protein